MSRSPQLGGKRRVPLQKQSAKWLRMSQIFTFRICTICDLCLCRLRHVAGDIRLAAQKASGYDDDDPLTAWVPDQYAHFGARLCRLPAKMIALGKGWWRRPAMQPGPSKPGFWMQ